MSGLPCIIYANKIIPVNHLLYKYIIMKKVHVEKFIVFLIALFFYSMPGLAEKVQGTVFLDINRNGIKDNNERGIPDVLVSNQKDVVKTDKNGSYEIEKLKNKVIYLVKPAEYGIDSYYLANDINSTDFALYPKEYKKTFDIIAVGDPQMRCKESLDAFQEDIVEEMLNYSPEFAIILGDIADNDLSIYPRTKEILAQLPYPVYPVFGNHDTNYQALSCEDEADIFQEYWGPDYYSFDEGQVHFIVLNNILYEGWNKKANDKGGYFGGISESQYEWLKNDLEYVSDNKLIVLNMHIPMLQDYVYKEQITRIFDLLKKRQHLLALSGHLHGMENYFFNEESWWSGASFQNITVGAACGSWWCGPKDERGIPVSTCMDGSPNGYFHIRFDGNKYSYHFIPANHRTDFQLRTVYIKDKNDLYVNVFSATSEASVIAELNGQKITLQNVMDEYDPFIEQTYNLRWNFDNWQGGKIKPKHLWKCHLPELQEGTYRINIEVIDVDGKKYEGYKLINVFEK